MLRKSSFFSFRTVQINNEDANDQAPRGEVQDRSQARPEHLGPAEIADQQARIRAWPAWPAPQGQTFRLRRAAARQTKTQGLLRQHVGAAFPRHLRRGAAAQRRYRRAYDRTA